MTRGHPPFQDAPGFEVVLSTISGVKRALLASHHLHVHLLAIGVRRLRSQEGHFMADATCRICGKTYSDRGMTRHLTSCLQKHSDTKTGVHLRVTDTWDSTFWLQLLADAEATLSDLDLLLRNVWLECCGHLSEFEIRDTRYNPSPSSFGFGAREESTNVPIARVLPDGESFSYTYDFGSSTYVEGNSYGAAPWPKDMEVESPESTSGIRVLSRNEMPEVHCSLCDRRAEWICADCRWHGEGLLCSRHARDHACGHDMLLPVVNSPRMGVCGYTGSRFDEVDDSVLR